MVKLGARLRRLRRERGVSQNELQRRSGLQSSYLSKVENDVLLPGLENLERIARALGLSLAEIVSKATPRGRSSASGSGRGGAGRLIAAKTRG